MDNLTYKQTVDCFNELLLDFISACEPLFINTKMADDLLTAKISLKALLQINILMPIEQYLLKVYLNYGNYIDNNDINKLLELDYSDTIKNTDLDLSKILDIKHLLNNMTHVNRLLILQYLQMLNRFAEKYYLFKK